MGEWIMCKDRVPQDRKEVICVKQLKSGRLVMCFGSFNPDFVNYKGEPEPYWDTSGGNHNVIAWMPLPALPEV